MELEYALNPFAPLNNLNIVQYKISTYKFNGITKSTILQLFIKRYSKMNEKKNCNLNMMKDAPVHVHQTSNYTRIIFIVIVQSQFMLFYNI